MTVDRSMSRHPSARGALVAVDDDVAPVVAHFDGRGQVTQYLWGKPPYSLHRHSPEAYKKWDITHEYDPDIDCVICIRTPVTTSP